MTARRPIPSDIKPGISATVHTTRRELLRLGAQALIAAPVFGLGAQQATAQAAAPKDSQSGAAAAAISKQTRLQLITKAIPSTGQRLPAIGIGTNAFKADNYPELKAQLQRMHELGGSVIDTANDYGDAEGVIGRALSELRLRKKIFLVTKCNALGGDAAWAPRGVVYGRASFERSLQRLQTDHVELMYAHHLPSVDPLMPWLQELKKGGRTRYIGIGTLRISEHAELADKMTRHPIDFVEVDYSLGNRDAADRIFPLAAERKIALMIDQPLGGRRGSLLKEVDNRPLPPWAAEFDARSWSQFFLKYVISHPAVTCAIPGSTKLEHLVDNQLAGHGRLPDAAMRKRMEQYWDAKV